jgi:hypothetical protein
MNNPIVPPNQFFDEAEDLWRKIIAANTIMHQKAQAARVRKLLAYDVAMQRFRASDDE